ncbi:response regulator transcription factor [Thiomonas sp.]|jgi:DNA-binding NarL/FixJ family response regulator|uniref:response regulator n=1 Tax=Thiomonas sp. TaxID=2047785 RepID=UPI00261E2AF2|nr:response regulator transcription factor [Thiomonas sp.]
MNRLDVLLADDHAIIRDGLRNILEDTDDLRCAGEAANGHALLQMVREREWSLLILDLSMPGRNGLELIKLVKAERPQLPILVFTMHQEEQYAVRAMRAGAAGYLTKEADGDVLLAAMRKVARGGVYVSAKVAELLATEVARPQHAPLHTLLSNREFEVFRHIVNGRSLTDIAAELSLSIKTVSTHKSHILDKLQAAHDVDLVRYALQHGLV